METRDILLKEASVLKDCKLRPVPRLDPIEFDPYGTKDTHRGLVTDIKKSIAGNSGKNALLIIGHQPLLGWVAYELTGEALPMVHSECLCIALEKKKWLDHFRSCFIWLMIPWDKSRWEILKDPTYGFLRWVLSPSNDKIMEEIKSKIKSKMEIAKLLSVFITTALGFLLATLVDQDKVGYLKAEIWAVYVSTTLFFLAVGLYLSTMYAYDRLLMPTRFWGEKPSRNSPGKRPKWLVWRPPSSAVWILYQNMMRIWRYLFTGATLAVFLGLFFLAYAVLKPEPLYCILTALVLGLLGYRYNQKFGPQLGAED